MHSFKDIEAKVFDWESLAKQVEHWQATGEKVVFTNGCFDLIHYGHLHYLASARDLGDHLIIALNADESVKRLKGEHRPIKDQLTRQLLLASLAFVDAVTVFEEDTPLKIIKKLQPDILVKGGDWTPDKIVGADVVLGNGGQVLSLPFVEGHSTTSIETKIRNSEKS